MMRTYTRKRPEYQEIEGVKELCRLCLEKPEESVQIFSDNMDNLCSGLVLRIMMCVGLEITKEDNLPDIICTSCQKELERYYAFRKKCEVSYQKLKYHLIAMKEKETNIKQDRKKEDFLNDVKEIEVQSENQNLIFTVNLDGTIQISGINNCLDNNELVSLLKKVGNILPEPLLSSGSIILGSEIQHGQIEDKQITSGMFTDNLETVTHNPVIDTQIPVLVTDNSELATENPINVINSAIPIDNTELTSESNNLILQDAIPYMELSTYIPTVLLGLGTLTQNEDLVVFDSNIDSLELEAGDGTLYTYEIVEESEHFDECPIQPATPKKENTIETVLIKSEKKTESNSKTNCMSKVNSTSKKKGKDNIRKSGQVWCNLCRKMFMNHSSFSRHIREVHNKEKPYSCKTCGMAFAQKNVMTRHMLVHEEKRPHQCPECPKSFTQRGSLESHRRVHTPPHSRPLYIHKCPKCPKVFLYPSGLSRHMMGIHAGKLHRCGGCDRTFTDRSSLIRHARITKHQQIPTTR